MQSGDLRVGLIGHPLRPEDEDVPALVEAKPSSDDEQDTKIAACAGDDIACSARPMRAVRPVGCIYSVSCCGCFVFVDESAEEVAPVDLGD
jgi:hypothetical protein